MKKNILFILIGMIIMAGIVVVADNLNASEIDYKETNVESALDTLYERSTYNEYDGSTTITPSISSQTLSTSNKLLKKNIIVKAIPSTFKSLTQSTTVTPEKLLVGETAYNNLGELVTGNLSTDCINGTHTWTQNDSNNGFVVANFTPSYFAINGRIKSDNTLRLYYYSSSVSTTKFFSVNLTTGTSESKDFSTQAGFLIENSKLTLKWSANNWNGQTISYIVCK